MSSGGSEVVFRMDGEVRMVAFVGEEGCDSSGSTRSVVVRKLRKREEFGPVVLLVVAIRAEVLFECLIRAFGLAIAFRVVTRGEVKTHVESFGQRPEEVRHEFGATVGGDVRGNSVLREDMEDEESGELRSGDGVVSRNKNGLLGHPIDDNEDSGEAKGVGELLDEIHGDGVPRFVGDRELLEGSVGLVTRSFRTSTSSTGTDVVFDEGADTGPGVIASD